jgi:hypothetical protein
MTAENTVLALSEHWQQFGIPSYAQFDNSTVFTGPRHPDTVGQVIRLCWSLGVTPVFVPPRETGFQANIERYNGQWQRSVWKRFRFKNYPAVVTQSDIYVEAHRDKHWASIEAVNNRNNKCKRKRHTAQQKICTLTHRFRLHMTHYPVNPVNLVNKIGNNLFCLSSLLFS